MRKSFLFAILLLSIIFSSVLLAQSQEDSDVTLCRITAQHLPIPGQYSADPLQQLINIQIQQLAWQNCMSNHGYTHICINENGLWNGFVSLKKSKKEIQKARQICKSN